MADSEEELRAEIARLQNQLAAREHRHRKPSSAVLWLIALLVLVLGGAAFFIGYLPRQKRVAEIADDAKTDKAAAPLVNVTSVEVSSAKSELVLPGNIQAIAEAPVLARASGYVKKRYADIGDHVKAGQVLAELDAPELGQQILQVKASVEQAGAALEQANANLTQGKTNEQLYKTTSDRYSTLAQRGAVSRQENDINQAQYQAQRATVQSLEKAVNVAKSNVGAAEANLARVTEMQSYLTVRAPFAGVVTQRNVDAGALVNEGSTLLFRVAQTGSLRIYVNVPQGDAVSVHAGQSAKISVPDLPARQFIGTVTRTAGAMDPATRTLLAEVQVPNSGGVLLPGMYAQVNFTTPRSEPPLLVKGDALVIRSNGPQVAVVRPDKTVHFVKVQLGRDYGDRIEVLSGLQKGQQLVINPGDSIQDGVKVNPVPLVPVKSKS